MVRPTRESGPLQMGLVHGMSYPMSTRHAVILAGGKGTRLRPYTTSIPKPLVPIGDESAILEIVLRQLALAQNDLEDGAFVADRHERLGNARRVGTQASALAAGEDYGMPGAHRVAHTVYESHL